jgi:hypothetical protein
MPYNMRPLRSAYMLYISLLLTEFTHIVRNEVIHVQCTTLIAVIFFPLALQPTFGPWPTSMKLSVSLQFTGSWTFGRTPWTRDQLVARPSL